MPWTVSHKKEAREGVYTPRSPLAGSTPHRHMGSVFRGSGGPVALAPLVRSIPSDSSSVPAALDESGRACSRSIGRSLATKARFPAAATVVAMDALAVRLAAGSAHSTNVQQRSAPRTLGH
ncbi:hypothetical protein COCOBI_19-0130 [Coccomyxa sp. Obi]|nr:hypothetical protein COCOBI_19-0130 [Coccomyxa sp. Obi]